MNLGRSCLIVISITMSGNSVFCQSDYLGRGEWGYEINAGYVTDGEVKGLSAAFGISISGRVDLGMVISRAYMNNSGLLGGDGTATSFGPGAFVHVFRSDAKQLPISAVIGVSYQRISYYSEALDVWDIDLKGESIVLLAGLYGNNEQTHEPVRIQPFMSIAHALHTLEFSSSDGRTQSVEESTTDFGFGMSFFVRLTTRATLRVEPQLSINIDSDNVTFGLSVGVIQRSQE